MHFAAGASDAHTGQTETKHHDAILRQGLTDKQARRYCTLFKDTITLVTTAQNTGGDTDQASPQNWTLRRQALPVTGSVDTQASGTVSDWLGGHTGIRHSDWLSTH